MKPLYPNAMALATSLLVCASALAQDAPAPFYRARRALSASGAATLETTARDAGPAAHAYTDADSAGADAIQPPEGVDDVRGAFVFTGPDGKGAPVEMVLRTLAGRIGLKLDVAGYLPGKVIVEVPEASAWQLLLRIVRGQGLRHEVELPGTLRIIGSASPDLPEAAGRGRVHRPPASQAGGVPAPTTSPDRLDGPRTEAGRDLMGRLRSQAEAQRREEEQEARAERVHPSEPVEISSVLGADEASEARYVPRSPAARRVLDRLRLRVAGFEAEATPAREPDLFLPEDLGDPSREVETPPELDGSLRLAPLPGEEGAELDDEFDWDPGPANGETPVLAPVDSAAESWSPLDAAGPESAPGEPDSSERAESAEVGATGPEFRFQERGRERGDGVAAHMGRASDSLPAGEAGTAPVPTPEEIEEAEAVAAQSVLASRLRGKLDEIREARGATAIRGGAAAKARQAPAAQLRHPRERRLANIRQLTFGGENAEAYFSFDGEWLIFQSTRGGHPCDQMYVMRTDGTSVRRVSTGEGRTTCGFFYPGDRQVLFSSTHHVSSECPPPPDYSRGYVWPLHPFDIFLGSADGQGPLEKLTGGPGYDAEATLSPDGRRIVFTSDRDGDLELYSMDLAGGDVRRLTSTPGYDGGAFFSPDSTRIVYRADHPKDEAASREMAALLAERLVRPSRMEIRVMNADGSGDRQVTSNGAANFAPYFHPDGRRILFASNMLAPQGRNFDLFLIHDDGTGLERVTFDPSFDAFPMFSPDGKQLVFASNRNASQPGETNIFLADWVE